MNSGGELRGSPVETVVVHAVGRGRCAWVEVVPDLPQELRKAGDVHGGSLSEQLCHL